MRDEEGIAALARRNMANGARVLKIFATGGISSNGTEQHEPPFRVREIRRAADVAHAGGLKLAAHAHGGAGARNAIEGGVDTIEHGAALDDRAIDAIVSRGLAVVATFSILFHPRGIEQGDVGDGEVIARMHLARATMQRSSTALLNAGARIAVGTDSMHGLLAFDLAKLVEFGATPLQALRAATVTGAEICGLADRGRLAAGLRADVIAVRGNPLESITNLEDPILVVANGRVARQAARA